MLLLHLMAKTYGMRPSAIVSIADEWTAYQFDAAVLLESLEDNGKGSKSAGKPVSWNWGELAKR